MNWFAHCIILQCPIHCSRLGFNCCKDSSVYHSRGGGTGGSGLGGRGGLAAMVTSNGNKCINEVCQNVNRACDLRETGIDSPVYSQSTQCKELKLWKVKASSSSPDSDAAFQYKESAQSIHSREGGSGGLGLGGLGLAVDGKAVVRILRCFTI